MTKQEMIQKIHDHFDKCKCGDDYYVALEMSNFDDLLDELYQLGYSNGYDVAGDEAAWEAAGEDI